MIKYLSKLLYILPANKTALFRIILLFIFTSILEVVGIGIIGPFIALASDFELINRNAQLKWLFENSRISEPNYFVILVGLFVMLTFCLKTFFSWFTQAYIIKFSDRQQHLLIVRMMREYLAAPYIYHAEKNSASIVDSVLEIANTFTVSILNPLLTTMANVLVTFCLVVMLYITSASTMLILLAVLLPVFIFFNLFKTRLQVWGKQMRESKESIIHTINHAFGGIKETKLIGCESYFEALLIEQAKKLEKSHSDFFTFKILPRFVIEAAMVVCVVGIVCFSLLMSSNIQELTSVLGVYALATIRMLPAVSNVLMGINQLRNSSYTVDQIYLEILELNRLEGKRVVGSAHALSSSDLSQIPDLNTLPFSNQIRLLSVSYQYPNSSKAALAEVSLSIQRGESIAFIGRSGAGKTTLIDVILGLLSPQKGNILVDGISIYSDIRAWQNLIGYIPQSIFLTDDTIERNIAFGVPDHLIDHCKMSKAIAAAQLEDVIRGLPDGIKTKVGERGTLLSGGQKQRVGIARALYHEREILVLDEATAALDTETEKMVTEAIKSLSGKKTIIIIAHRLSTIEHCDRIYQLSEGRIIKSGNYREVVLEGAGA